MKKATSIFLIFIYAFTTTGVAVKADYCCNNLKSVKLVLADDAKGKEGCCAVKYQSFKIKDAHAAADVSNTPALQYTFIHILHTPFKASELNYQIFNHVVNIHAPPLYATIPVYISNCTLRI